MRQPAHLPRSAVPGSAARPRHGVVLVEGAVVSLVLFLLLFVTLDLGLAVLRFNAVSEAARRVARAAMVHGQSAPPAMSEWGPDAYAAEAADDSEMAAVARPILVTMDPAEVELRLEWPDGANRVNDRVRVSVTYQHQPLFAFGLGAAAFRLSATSTVRIAH